LMISESAMTEFSLTISKSTGAVCAAESTRHLWSCFVDVFGVCKDSVFVDYFWVIRGFLRWRIHASLMEAVSLTICESTGAVCGDESMPHLWKQFRWWFLSLQQLSFRWLFLSQQGHCALTNPSVTCRSDFVNDFWDLATQFSLTISESTRVVCADKSTRPL
jgi:hypothetical protein